MDPMENFGFTDKEVGKSLKAKETQYGTFLVSLLLLSTTNPIRKNNFSTTAAAILLILALAGSAMKNIAQRAWIFFESLILFRVGAICQDSAFFILYFIFCAII
jgi:hypothetical protein